MTAAIRGHARWWLAVLIGIAGLVVAASLWASGDPDGLNRIAEDLGFTDAAQGAPYELLPGYSIPGIDGTVSKILAGLVGVVVVLALLWVVGKLLTRRQPPEPGAGS